MKLLDSVKRSGRNLKAAKMRTLLTALAIGVGGFTLTATLAASAGAHNYTNKLVSTNFDPSSLVVAKDSKLFGPNGSVNTKPQEYSDSLTTVGGERGGGTVVKELDSADIAKIEKLPGVASVFVNYQASVQFVTKNGQKKYTGTLRDYNPAQKPTMAAGLAPDTVINGTVLLPDNYISLLDLGSSQAAVGKTITIQVRQLTGQTEAKSFTIAGVTTQPATSISLTASDILLSTNDAKSLFSYINSNTVNADKFITVTARVTNGTDKAQLDKVKAEVISAGYSAVSVQDTQQFLSQIINILQIIILVFGAITLVASFFGVVNTQYISVLERTREIGLMKALGMSRSTVSRLFMIEATWIGFLGAVLGSLAAIAVGTLLNPWISRKLNFGSDHLLIFKPAQVVMLVVFLMLVTTVAGLLPARKAAKLNPIDALRTE